MWLWWKQLWCPHDNMIRGVMGPHGVPWSQCLTCGRRVGPPKVEKKAKMEHDFWRPPNFPAIKSRDDRIDP